MKLELSVHDWSQLLPALSQLEERVWNLERAANIPCQDPYLLRNITSRILGEQRYSLKDIAQ